MGDHNDNKEGHKTKMPPSGYAEAPPSSSEHSEHDEHHAMMEREKQEAQLTCDVLCSLSASSKAFNSGHDTPQAGSPVPSACSGSRKCDKECPKQLQLPMFLSSKFIHR